MSFAPVKKLKVTEQIARELRDHILSGRAQPGQALPSERELAEQFGVNRSSIREALHRLEAFGLVEISQGSATLVRNFLLTAGPEILPFFVAPDGASDPHVLEEVLAIRSMVLAWTAKEAARAATPRDLSRLAAIVESLERGGLSREEIQLLDFEFFEELVRLVGNRVLTLLVNAIRRVYMAHPELFAALYEPAAFDPGRHRRALEAIAAHDPALAAASMELHADEALDLSRASDAVRSRGRRAPSTGCGAANGTRVEEGDKRDEHPIEERKSPRDRGRRLRGRVRG